MRRDLSILAGLVIGGLTAGQAQNLQRPPGAAEQAYAAQIGWPQAAEKLGAALRAAYQPGHGGVPGSSGNASFQSWLLLYRWCELLSRSESDEMAAFLGGFFFLDGSEKDGRPIFVAPGLRAPAGMGRLPDDVLKRYVADPKMVAEAGRRLLPPHFQLGAGSIAQSLRPEFLSAMAGDQEFLRAFFANLSDRDYAPEVLKILQEIWTADAARFAEYRNLAIALALVRDQQAPTWWPHSQVKPADVPRESAAPRELFKFWVASNEGRRLFTDLRRLSPEELKFVVDAPVATSELEWGQKNARFPRGDFSRAFSSINYRFDRLEKKEYDWNEGPYTLAEIQRRGGICVDQAYFAMLGGKSRGLPTLYFSGQGTDGGHAWFGYLKGENRWDMDCGRYINQNYAVGEALDPQTWLPINDHELASLAESFRRTPGYLASQCDLDLAVIFERAGDNARALAALDSAISVSPRNDLAWAKKGEFLVRSGAPLAKREAYHQAAIQQFVNNDDLKVAHQRALADLARTSGNEKTAGDLEGKIISQNRRSRADLSVNAAATRLAGLIEAKKFDEAMREYRNLLSRLGRTSGGNFFYEIVRPLALSLAHHGDVSAARRAVDLARGALRPEPGSILDQELDSLVQFLAAPAASKR